MDASVFIRQPNASEYTDLGQKKFSILPRMDEFISADHQGTRQFFQVVGVHHSLDGEAVTQIYCVQTEPSWEVKRPRAIGFGV